MEEVHESILQAARLATGQLGWTPDAFWRATPRELLLALEGRFGRSQTLAPLGRGELLQLMEKLGNG